MDRRFLDIALLGGTAFFLAMAAAHFFSIKVPVLFVYYDTPFYAYQDKIIAFAVLAYAGLWLSAWRSRTAMPMVLAVMAATVLGLSYVNISEDLAGVLEGQGTLAYWLQTVALGGYGLMLAVFYGLERKA